MSFTLGDYYFGADGNGLCVSYGEAIYCFPYSTLAALAFLLVLIVLMLGAAALAVSRFRWRRERKGD